MQVYRNIAFKGKKDEKVKVPLFFSADVSFRSPWCSNKVSIIHRIGRNVNNLFHEKVIFSYYFCVFYFSVNCKKIREYAGQRRVGTSEEKRSAKKSQGEPAHYVTSVHSCSERRSQKSQLNHFTVKQCMTKQWTMDRLNAQLRKAA